MLPAITGYVSAQKIGDIFTGKSVTVHQSGESMMEPEFLADGPWIAMSIQLVPEIPVSITVVSEKDDKGNQTGITRRVVIQPKIQSIIQTH